MEDNNLLRKSYWCYLQVRQNFDLGPLLSIDEFGDQQVDAFSVYYQLGAQFSLLPSSEYTERILHVGWHFPEYPMLVSRLHGKGCHFLLAEATRWLGLIPIENRIMFRSGLGDLRKLYRTFRDGIPIACMLDYCYDGTQYIESSFLGSQCRTPIGALHLAKEHGYTVKLWKNPHEVDVSVDLQSTDVVMAAAAINQAIGSQIALDPARWLLWASLDRRWSWWR